MTKYIQVSKLHNTALKYFNIYDERRRDIHMYIESLFYQPGKEIFPAYSRCDYKTYCSEDIEPILNMLKEEATFKQGLFETVFTSFTELPGYMSIAKEQLTDVLKHNLNIPCSYLASYAWDTKKINTWYYEVVVLLMKDSYET